MRMLLISSVFPKSESDDQVPWLRESCRRLKESGVEIEILAPSCRGLKNHKINGIFVYRFRYGPAAWERLTGEEGATNKIRKNPWLKVMVLPYIWCGFWNLTELLLKNAAAKKKYDLIEVHWPFPNALIALPALWAGIPLVYRYYTAELKLSNQNIFYRLLFKWILGWARAHVAISGYSAALVKKINPKLAVEVVPYGSGSPVESREEKAQVNRKRRQILFVGRHIERKGIPYLIEAMKLLPRDYSLTLVGEGDQTLALKSMAATWTEGQGKITFTGKISNEAIALAYATHDIFVLPAIVDSRGDTEGLGVVLVEAINAGIPIVASNVGGITDIIINNQTGLLTPEKDSVALAEAIRMLANDEDLVQRLVTGARAHAQKVFGWPMITERLREVYAKL